MIHDLNYGLNPGRTDWRITVLWDEKGGQMLPIFFWAKEGSRVYKLAQVSAKAKVKFRAVQRNYK